MLSPSNVQEVLDLGVFGWELSRYSGCWVALKAITENMDAATKFAGTVFHQTEVAVLNFMEDKETVAKTQPTAWSTMLKKFRFQNVTMNSTLFNSEKWSMCLHQNWNSQLKAMQ